MANIIIPPTSPEDVMIETLRERERQLDTDLQMLTVRRDEVREMIALLVSRRPRAPRLPRPSERRAAEAAVTTTTATTTAAAQAAREGHTTAAVQADREGHTNGAVVMPFAFTAPVAVPAPEAA